MVTIKLNRAYVTSWQEIGIIITESGMILPEFLYEKLQQLLNPFIRYDIKINFSYLERFFTSDISLRSFGNIYFQSSSLIRSKNCWDFPVVFGRSDWLLIESEGFFLFFLLIEYQKRPWADNLKPKGITLPM